MVSHWWVPSASSILISFLGQNSSKTFSTDCTFPSACALQFVFRLTGCSAGGCFNTCVSFASRTFAACKPSFFVLIYWFASIHLLLSLTLHLQGDRGPVSCTPVARSVAPSSGPFVMACCFLPPLNCASAEQGIRRASYLGFYQSISIARSLSS